MPPTVSINIPACNCQEYLAQTLDSLLAQTFEDWECIIVDDHSTDDTYAIAQSYARRDARFKPYLLPPEEKRPYPFIRNVAIERSTGAWIAPLDGDDWWDANKLQTQLDALAARPGAVWSYHGMRMMRNGEVVFEKLSHDPQFVQLDYLLLSTRVIQSSTLINREKLAAIGNYTLDMYRAQDWDLWLRLVMRYGSDAAVCVPTVLGNYRVHDGNISSHHGKLIECERRLMRRLLINHGLLVRKPVTAMKMIDSQILRELERHKKAGHRKRAKIMALFVALMRPDKGWRWKQFASI